MFMYMYIMHCVPAKQKFNLLPVSITDCYMYSVHVSGLCALLQFNWKYM